MYIDGLYATRMTLHIHRDDAPIPQAMQQEYLTLELSAVQMNAIAAVLGLGYRSGELLYYRDDDVDKNIRRTDGFGIQANYHAINCDSRRRRLSKTVNKPLVESEIGGMTSAKKTSAGYFDFVMDVPVEDQQLSGVAPGAKCAAPSSVSVEQGVSEEKPVEARRESYIAAEESSVSEEARNLMAEAAMAALGIMISADEATIQKAKDLAQHPFQTGMPSASEHPFSSMYDEG